MSKKKVESDKKLKPIIKEKYKTFSDCTKCLASSKGCDRGKAYVQNMIPGRAYKCVPCFKGEK